MLLKIVNCNKIHNPVDKCGQILTTIFNMDLFYDNKNYRLNISSIDTITILDKKCLLSAYMCSNIYNLSVDSSMLKKGMDYSWGNDETKALVPYLKPASANKICLIRNIDSIPLQILRFNATKDQSENSKYLCYFSLEKMTIHSDTVDIELIKYITNHILKIVLVKHGKNYKVIDCSIGQI